MGVRLSIAVGKPKKKQRTASSRRLFRSTITLPETDMFYTKLRTKLKRNFNEWYREAQGLAEMIGDDGMVNVWDFRRALKEIKRLRKKAVDLEKKLCDKR
jgi:CRISPR/Cas system endoribonuclease Cas6 (RAMP superfamily)